MGLPLQYKPEVVWRAFAKRVVITKKAIDEFPAEYSLQVIAIDKHEQGSNTIEPGYFFMSFMGDPYTIFSYDELTSTIVVVDEFRIGKSPTSNKIGIVYKSMGSGLSPYLAPIYYRYLHRTALDNSKRIEQNILWQYINLINTKWHPEGLIFKATDDIIEWTSGKINIHNWDNRISEKQIDYLPNYDFVDTTPVHRVYTFESGTFEFESDALHYIYAFIPIDEIEIIADINIIPSYYREKIYKDRLCILMGIITSVDDGRHIILDWAKSSPDAQEVIDNYVWNLHGPQQIVGNLANPENIAADADGTGAVDTTIPTGTYTIVAINAVGETLPVDVPEIVILEDTSTVVVSWDAVEGATGYRVYEVSTSLYYDLISNVWLYYTQVPAIAGTLPTENTALVYQNSFAINNDDTVEITGEGIDVETEVDELDSTIKRILLKKQQSSWSETDEDSPNFIPGKPESFDGRGIASLVLFSTVGLVKTYRITFTDDTTFDFAVTDGDDGDDGDDGRGITSVSLFSTVGLVKTYRITFTDATTFDFSVTDGDDGTGGGSASVIQTTGTLLAANWVADGSLFKYVLSNANITATTSVDVIPAKASYDVLVAAEPMPETESAAGTVSMWVKNIPTADIPVTINITEVI